MKTRRSGWWMGALAAVVAMDLPVHAVELAAPGTGIVPEPPRQHLFYVGFGYGPMSFQPGNNERQLEGIDFRFNTDVSDLGGLFYAGYWISDHFGLEVGGRDQGNIKVPFEFDDPHDNTSGTGESLVSLSGFSVSLMFGADLVRDLQVFGRLGALSWQEDLESRFDIPGQPAMRRTTSYSGTGTAFGAGLSWRVASGWHVVGQYEHETLGEDQLDLVSVGMAYDFLGLARDPADW